GQREDGHLSKRRDYKPSGSCVRESNATITERLGMTRRSAHAGGGEHPATGVSSWPRLPPGHVRYGCGRDDARTTGTAPHKCADRQRAAALTLPQREKLGVDDVVGAGISAGAESDRTAYPRGGV